MFTEVTSHHQLFNESFLSGANKLSQKVDYVKNQLVFEKIDAVSFHSAEIHSLHKETYNLVPQNLRNYLGSTSLLASLVNPPTDIEEINARQKALKEIETNKPVRDFIGKILEEYSSAEENILNYVSGYHSMMEAGWQFKVLKKFVKNLKKICSDIPKTESELLNQVFAELKDFQTTEESKIVTGPTLRTIKGLKSRKKALFLPRYHLRSAPFDTVTLFSIGAYMLPVMGAKMKDVSQMHPQLIPIINAMQNPDVRVFGAMAAMGMLFWPIMMKPMADEMLIHTPLSKLYRQSRNASKTLGAIGFIGELYALYSLNTADAPCRTTPVFHESDRFEFSATNMHNPLATIRGQKIVPNDFTLGDNRLVSIEGSNSGGKTFFCKGAFQTQMLAQLGADVFADSYSCSTAEHFFYQIVSSGTQDSDDGNFGSGLERAAYLLYRRNLNKKFFAVLDELAEGTTQPEKIETAGPVLHAFRIIGAGILWANHNYELVEMMPPAIVDPWKIEMKDNAPTHKLVRGVSYSSGAQRVVRKHKLDPDSLRTYLHDHGFDAPNKFIGENYSTRNQ